MTLNPRFYQLGTEVKLTKLKAVKTHPNMLDESYWLQGQLLAELKVGMPIEVMRRIRNGVETPGIFTSSNIVKIEGHLIYTNNSVWSIYQV